MRDTRLPPSELAERIRAHVERLCAEGDRNPGTDRNRAATDYVSSVMRTAELEVEELPFEVLEWRYGEASVRADDRLFGMHPGPFSSSVDEVGPLVEVTHVAELRDLDANECVLLLRGPIAQIQFTPRGYPFYQNHEHADILEALEATQAIALIAATDKNPSMTAGMSPFPLIEEPGFAVPTAYMGVEDGAALAAHVGERVHVSVDSRTGPSAGVQPVGNRVASGAGRIVIGAHVDSKPDTPGAVDNACGVAVMLAVAELLRDVELEQGLEFVPFNGEDHVLAPGELAYLGSRDLSGVEIMVNIDGVGLPGFPSACSHYNATETLVELLERLAANSPAVVLGEPWPASDHMIFAMQGIACFAVTSQDFASLAGVYAHTPLDSVDVPDFQLLAGTALFVAEMVQAIAGTDRTLRRS